MKKQQGSTLVKVVMGIAVLSILFIVFSHKLVDLDGAALLGVSGAATTAMANNYELCVTLNHNSIGTECIEIDNCDDVAKLLVNASLPEGYTTVASLDMTENAETLICTLTQTVSGKTANFTAVAAGLL